MSIQDGKKRDLLQMTQQLTVRRIACAIFLYFLNRLFQKIFKKETELKKLSRISFCI